MRRGIAFGPEVTEEEKKKQETMRDRGLVFICYQSSIANGFQFIQKRKFGCISATVDLKEI
jgi:deferrochelatase/peroxidase EfeB